MQNDVLPRSRCKQLGKRAPKLLVVLIDLRLLRVSIDLRLLRARGHANSPCELESVRQGLLAINASAQTIPRSKQTRAPTSSEETKPQQQQAAPPPIIVNVLPAPKSPEEAEQERRERAEKAETDKRLVDLTADLATFTKWLAFATFALVAATAGLVVMGLKQSKDMRESLRIADNAAKAALKSAEAAETQTAIVAHQTDIIQKQHAVGRLQHFATHRPRLRIRHVNLIDPDAIFDDPKRYGEGVEVKGGLVVVNAGGTQAQIVESRYRIVVARTGLPIEPPYTERFNVLLERGQTLNIGESCTAPISDSIRMQAPRSDPPALFIDIWKIYVMGQIRYEDEGGAERFMGFCRERGDDGRFRPVNDADYEYED